MAQFGRGVFWGKPVFRLTASSQLAESLARGWVEFLTRRNEHTSGVEAKFRGMETAKFGRENGMNDESTLAVLVEKSREKISGIRKLLQVNKINMNLFV